LYALNNYFALRLPFSVVKEKRRRVWSFICEVSALILRRKKGQTEYDTGGLIKKIILENNFLYATAFGVLISP